jgi:hypothetical protein
VLSLQVEFNPREAGVFRALPQFDVPGQPGRLLDIGATAVASDVHLITSDGAPIDSALVVAISNASSVLTVPAQGVPFGPIYFGQERVFTALLSNPTPNPFTFVSSHNAGPADDDSQASAPPVEEDDGEGHGSVTHLLAPTMTVEPYPSVAPL